MIDVLKKKKSQLEKKIRAREFVFGIQDGLVSTVGLLSGVAVATQNSTTILITGIAAGLTGGLSMATGSYLSTRTEKDLFEREMLDQEELAKAEPYLAHEALLENLVEEGLDRPSSYKVVKMMKQHQNLLLRTVQEKVLGLGSADLAQPFKAATVMYLSFLLGAAVPVLPFFFLTVKFALPLSWIFSILALLGVGIFKGLITKQPLFSSGLKFAAVALGSASSGWVIGKGIEMFLAR
ncbi:hypothetical protein BVX98_06890 [bacterium F11]|nr:hypothetical protein BVX98_06890 [bacterium F11]